MTNDPRPSDPIDPQELRRALSGTFFGVDLRYHATLESTNSLLKSLAANGAPDGTVVVADAQTGGRGRVGRSWLSLPGANLLFSILLRARVEPEQVFALTMILAVSAAEVLHRRTGVAARIKWPNDLYAGQRKLAGILTEFGVKGSSVDYVVLGMGLNVQWHPAGQEEIRGPATSVRMETGKVFPRADLLVRILKEFENSYGAFLNGDTHLIYSKWNDLSLILGRNVMVETGAETIRGRAVRIDQTGALILELESGVRRKILCGDVSLRLE
ncbi:MAG: biotin--[acetyl-CoA-carboxylase] ligase [Deltaproteobacteria bacterium HGW-Deltaproteobacteria-15]|jgi:BirA family biotin operon repressor/biotin-[acetyl-CoA-carboxylase] ligase|nr:MAG: biotin--[acetyl-CoA-carboxylase] ligase [Deltaproteobacteria bacterium HGW-Deltaproteobacteria-15]